jgi:tetratricopeptide (TPR) repeat protein
MPDPATEEILGSATAQFHGGRFREAEQGFRQVLQREPDNVAALNLLGTLIGMAGNAAAAAELIARALSLRPDDPDLLENLAIALERTGRTKEAQGARNRAASIRRDPAPLIALGDLFRKHQAIDKALDCYQRAAAMHPAAAAAHHASGSLLLQRNRIEPAIAALQRAAELAPGRSGIHRDLAIALLQVQRNDEGRESAERALAINPTDVLALAHMGLALNGLGRLDEAREYFQKVVALPAGGSDEIFNRGVALENLDRLEEAIVEYKRVAELDPKSVSAFLSIGGALERCAKTEEALHWLDKAAALAPDFALVHVNRAVVLLVKGYLAEGWKEHDWRWRCPLRNEPPRILPQLLWREQSVAGKTLLLHGEQGFGDVIQFVRYAALAKARGAKVLLEVHPELVGLMKTVEGVDQVIARHDPLPDFDLHAPLMDLPLIFGTELSTIPAHVPYLHAQAAKVAQWAARLASGEPQGRPKLRVGLVWAARPNRAFDRTRSMTLDQFAPIVESAGPDVSFFSLQKGAAAGQLVSSPVAFAISDYSDQLQDFTDTAALLAQLDLLISVDTGVAHLAGAMGIAQWILLGLPADWRWLEHREDCPWYPAARLFRQQVRGEWPAVIARVVGELRNLVAAKESLTR